MSAQTALSFGFQGKMCIHPKQIAPVHRVFTPSETEAAYAERVVAAFAEAEAVGSVAISSTANSSTTRSSTGVLEKMAAIRTKEERQ